MSIKGTQALILAPTRGLAKQIQKIVIALGDYMNIECHACVEGTNDREEIAKFQEGVHVVVGTPGRVLDMINRRAFRTNHLRIFCLDEADELLSRIFSLKHQDFCLDEADELLSRIFNLKDQTYEGKCHHTYIASSSSFCPSFPTSPPGYSSCLVLNHDAR
jgi:hypothetical protein